MPGCGTVHSIKCESLTSCGLGYDMRRRWQLDAAIFKHLTKTVRVISNDTVDIHFNKLVHPRFSIDGPGYDLEAQLVRLQDLAGVNLSMKW